MLRWTRDCWQSSEGGKQSREGHQVVENSYLGALRTKELILARVGDRVGVGAQSASCLKPDCEQCANGEENHCSGMINTYDSQFSNGDKSYGGYANYSRVPSHFVLKIPDAIASEDAAPMLCGGVTVYSPLKKNGCGPGKRVGIIGVGGLGHFGLLYAKVAVIRSPIGGRS